MSALLPNRPLRTRLPSEDGWWKEVISGLYWRVINTLLIQWPDHLRYDLFNERLIVGKTGKAVARYRAAVFYVRVE